jgi:hypothetical protein
MKTTRRLMILGATGLAGTSQVGQAARRSFARPPPSTEALSLSALLAAGRGALASSRREG